MIGAISYALRFLLAVGILLFAFVLPGHWGSAFTDTSGVGFILGHLSVYHDLFYGTFISLILFALVLRAAEKTKPSRPPKRWRVGALMVFLLILTLLPSWLASVGRGGLTFPRGHGVSVLLLLFNFTAAAFFLRGEETARKRSFGRGVVYAVVVADLLAPLLVWGAYRRKSGRRLIPLVVLPGVLLWLIQLAPWVMNPPPFDDAGRLHPAFHYFDTPASLYQIEVDPHDGGVIAAAFPNSIRKIDPASQTETSHAVIDPHFDQVQGFGADPLAGEIIYVDAVKGRTWVFDQSDLHLKRRVAIANPVERSGLTKHPASRTQFDSRTGTLLSFDFVHYAAQLNRTGDRVVGLISGPGPDALCNNVSDMVIDAKRRLVHGVSWSKRLVAWDLDAHRIVRSLMLPGMPDRVALDDVRDRLILPLPASGRLLVVDAATYRQVALVESIPGVRAPVLSQQTKRLYLACVTPFLEIRSLDDYALLDRIAAPPWARWAAIDETRGRLFEVVRRRGLYWAELSRIHAGGPGAWIRRWDPFYLAFRWSVDLLLKLHLQPGSILSLAAASVASGAAAIGT